MLRVTANISDKAEVFLPQKIAMATIYYSIATVLTADIPNGVELLLALVWDVVS